MDDQPQTWHYGLVAQHWAEFENFREAGEDITFYQRLIESSGQPALDVGCGTGRLLVPFLRAGLEVDGCDISPDMLAHCREKAAGEGFSPNLYPQAMHALDLPRSYQTIIICGSFGIGSTREQDALALERFYQHLTPGGTLALDMAMPYGEGYSWQWGHWLEENRQHLDPNWWPEGEFETAADGSAYRMRARIADVDPLEQVLTMQMRAERWRDEELLEEEVHTLTQNVYFKNELVLLLKQAGFEGVTVQGGFAGEAATRTDAVLVFVAMEPFVRRTRGPRQSGRPPPRRIRPGR